MKKISNAMVEIGSMVLIVLLFAGCQSQTSKMLSNTTDVQKQTEIGPLKELYETDNVAFIKLGNNIKIEGDGVLAEDQVITISQSGTYMISGQLENGRIVVDTSESDQVQIVMKDASIHCEKGSPVYVKKAKEFVLTLEDGTENRLSDGTEYLSENGENDVDSAIFSWDNLTINGSGKLKIEANYRHGITSKKKLSMNGGVIEVTAKEDGLCGKEGVTIQEGKINLNVGRNGVRSKNQKESQKGNIYVKGGILNIVAEETGIYATTDLWIEGGQIDLIVGKGANNHPNDFVEPDQIYEDSSAFHKTGLKTDGEIVINSGLLMVDAYGDTLHSSKNVTVNGGELKLQSGEKGIHADSNVTINSGVLTITKSYEGIEGNCVLINNGSVYIKAVDDGINADGRKEVVSGNAQAGGNPQEGTFICMAGGVLQIDALGDGIDSNGSFYMNGGTAVIQGASDYKNSSLDYDETAEVTGGILMAISSPDHERVFADNSSQYSIAYSWPEIISGGTMITLKDSKKKVVVVYTPEREFQSVVITAPQLKPSYIYTIQAGDYIDEIVIDNPVTKEDEKK